LLKMLELLTTIRMLTGTPCTTGNLATRLRLELQEADGPVR
jgi:hypothetical protein